MLEQTPTQVPSLPEGPVRSSHLPTCQPASCSFRSLSSSGSIVPVTALLQDSPSRWEPREGLGLLPPALPDAGPTWSRSSPSRVRHRPRPAGWELGSRSPEPARPLEPCVLTHRLAGPSRPPLVSGQCRRLMGPQVSAGCACEASAMNQPHAGLSGLSCP